MAVEEFALHCGDKRDKRDKRQEEERRGRTSEHVNKWSEI